MVYSAELIDTQTFQTLSRACTQRLTLRSSCLSQIPEKLHSLSPRLATNTLSDIDFGVHDFLRGTDASVRAHKMASKAMLRASVLPTVLALLVAIAVARGRMAW